MGDENQVNQSYCNTEMILKAAPDLQHSFKMLPVGVQKKYARVNGRLAKDEVYV